MTKEELHNSLLNDKEKSDIIEHMNRDHADAILNYAIVYGGVLNANHGTMLDLTPYGMAIEYELEESRNICRIAFQEPIKNKKQYKEVLISMAKQAAALLR